MNRPESHKHYVTKAEDKIPFKQKVFYGSGSFAEMSFQWLIINLAMPIFNAELGVDPILIGIVIGISRIWDSITDPVMGSISDNARTPFGRRRPFIASGAILAGLMFCGIWLFPREMSETGYFWYFLVATLIYYTCFTIFSVPFYAFGYEISPDYHERTRMMAVRIFSNSFNGVIFAPWVYWMIQRQFWDDTIQGIRFVGIGVGLLMLILALVPALMIKERVKTYVQKQKKVSVLKSVKSTLRCKPFLILVIAFLLTIFGNTLVSTLTFYPTVYYVFDGDKDLASIWYGFADATHHIATLIMIIPISMMSRRFGKRSACIFFTSFIVIGSILQIFSFNPDAPWMLIVPRAFLGVGWAGFWVLIPAMIADVVDYDEWNTGTRREGMFGAVHFWVVKLGFALGFFATGYVVNMTGFQIELGVDQPAHTFKTMILLKGLVPAISALISALILLRFAITEDKAYQIRADLEDRRGKV
ncbi:MAG: hypothetical protein CMI18_07810 [Opitutaceae bacterium]|nr:hypothetical protein [Opitutaceae bacterium]|tara:strand:+ start:67 stop:1485 length:1419 start_codon:yes stop_codon:yes gene_type:complete